MQESWPDFEQVVVIRLLDHIEFDVNRRIRFEAKILFYDPLNRAFADFHHDSRFPISRSNPLLDG
jgi:hypothetical protein